MRENKAEKAAEETRYLISIPGMAESIRKGGDTDISECLDESQIDWQCTTNDLDKEETTR